MDQAFWQSIVESNYSVPESHAITDLRDTLLTYLGSSDPLWRDEFAYMILANWITDGHFSPDDLVAMIPQLSANLRKSLGANGTDSVLLRSFSILILSELVYYDNEHPYLSEKQVNELLTTCLYYCATEKDIRGYLYGKGWAHSCAHTADMLAALAANRHIGADELLQILNAIVDKLATITKYMYVHGEDERLTEVVLSTLKRELLTIEQWQTWINRFEQVVIEKNKNKGFDLGVYGAKRNTKNFLRSVYLQLEMSQDPLPLSDQLKPLLLQTLKKFPY